MISICVTTRDNERCIGEVLEALSWCEDVVVIDRNSTDTTLEITKTFANVSIGAEPKHDWVLSLNGNEVISDELKHELQELEPDIDLIYAMPVHTYFNGKQIRHGGWHSRGEPRLTHTKHPHVRKTVTLKSPLLRYPFASIEGLLKRIQSASSRFAKRHKKPSFWKTFIAPPLVCMKAYIFQLGFLDGYEGLILAKFRAHKVYYSELKLREARQDKPTIEGAPISDES